MPQIDFGQAFSSPDTESAAPQAGESSAPEGISKKQTRARRFGTSGRLGKSQWANILYVSVTFLGGLFCAFYFFNGSELLRAAAAWGREFLYPPPSLAQNAARFGGPDQYSVGGGSATSPDRGGDPFSRSTPFGLTPPTNVGTTGAGTGLPSTATVPGLSSPLGQIGFPAPGGDLLAQAFNRAVTDLQRISALDARRTVVVIQTAVTRVEKRTNARAKNAAQGAANAAGNVAGQQGGQTSDQASKTAGSAQNQVNASANAANNAAQSSMSSVRGTLGNPAGALGGFRAPVSMGSRGGGGRH